MVCSNTAAAAGAAAVGAAVHPWQCAGPAGESLSVLLDNHFFKICILKESQDLLSNTITVLLSIQTEVLKDRKKDLVDPGASVESPGDG